MRWKPSEKKNKKDNTVLFIDATNDCEKVTNNNKLREADINKIVAEFVDRKDIEHISHVATYDEIKAQDYNLSVSTYVKAKQVERKINIQELNESIKTIVLKEEKLRAEIDKIIAEIEA